MPVKVCKAYSFVRSLRTYYASVNAPTTPHCRHFATVTVTVSTPRTKAIIAICGVHVEILISLKLKIEIIF